MAAAGRFSVDTIFGAKDHMSGPISVMQSRATRFEKSLGGANRVADAGAAGVTKFAVATAAAGAGAGAILANVMQTGMTFEKALLSAGNKFEAGISKDSATFKQLSAIAQQVGGSTEFNATQAANGLRELAGAGLDAGQAMSALPGTVDLATAAEMTDMAAATEIAVKSLGAFGLKSKDPLELAKNLERVSDVLVKTDDISSTSVSAFFEAIAEGGAVGKTAGANIETYGALVAGLSDIEQGSKAGTTLKNMFLTLSKPTKEAGAVFKKFGIKTTDAMGNTRDAIDVLAELNTATSKLGSGDKAGALEDIFGKIPLAGVMTLMGKIDEVRANRDKLQTEAGGSVKKKAESMRSGGTSALDNFTSGVEAVSLALFDLVGGPINDVINRTTEWIGANRELIATNVADFINKAIPLFENFADGVRDAFEDAKPLIEGVGGALSGVFGPGASGSRIQAYELGNTMAKLGMAFFSFWLVTKAVTAATTVWSIVVGVAKAGMLAYETAVAAGKWALVSYQIWSKAGTASTLAMSSASFIATGNMIAQRAGAFGAAVGMKAVAVASWAATVPVLAVAAAIGAVLAAGYQLMAFANENGGLEGIGGALGIGTEGWGFEGVDEVMNRQAKARAASGNNGGAPSGSASGMDLAQLSSLIASSAGSTDKLSEQLAALEKSSGQMPPGMGPTPLETAGGMPLPGMPPVAATSREPAVVSLKEDSSAQLSQSMGAAVKGALKGVLTIELKDPGKAISSVETNGSDVMSIAPSGGF